MCTVSQGFVPESRGIVHHGGLWVCTGLLSQRAQTPPWAARVQTGNSEGTRGHQQFSGQWVLNEWNEEYMIVIEKKFTVGLWLPDKHSLFECRSLLCQTGEQRWSLLL